MERTPKRLYEYLAMNGSERLTIDAPCEVRAFRHGNRVRLEFRGWLKEPTLVKILDVTEASGDIDGTT